MSLLKEHLKRLEERLSRDELVKNGDKLLLAISAGADSTAMLYLFSRLRFTNDLSLLAVHINHQLRDEESDKDESHVRELCLKLNIPLIIRKIKLQGEHDWENRARDKRKEIFNQVLAVYKFDLVVLAHHKWDVAETFLLNIFRGAGLSGMASIRPKNEQYIHPLLDFEPQELKALLREEGISWREDESNQDFRFTRNRVRHQLMPSLEEHYNPLVQEKLAESAAIIEKAEAYILKKAMGKFKKVCIESSAKRVLLSLPQLMKLEELERYYIIREAYNLICGTTQDFFQSHIRELNKLFESEGSKYISLPNGVFAIRRYQELLFIDDLTEIMASEAGELTIDSDRARAVFLDHRFQFKYLKVLPEDVNALGNMTVIIDADKVIGKIKIRQRKDGDRFIPLGMKNLKKLKDFFIDEKVAKYDRDLIPIFEDEEKIIWVCGFRIDDRVRYEQSSSRYLMISAESMLEKSNRAASRKK